MKVQCSATNSFLCLISSKNCSVIYDLVIYYEVLNKFYWIVKESGKISHCKSIKS